MVIIRDERAIALRNRESRRKKFGGLRHSRDSSPSAVAEDNAPIMSYANPEDYPEGGFTVAAVNDLAGGSTRAPQEDLRQQSLASQEDIDRSPAGRFEGTFSRGAPEVVGTQEQGTISITQPVRVTPTRPQSRLEPYTRDRTAYSFFTRQAERGQRLNNPALAIGSGFALGAIDTVRAISDPVGTTQGLVTLGGRLIVEPQNVVGEAAGGFASAPLVGSGRLLFDAAFLKGSGKLIEGSRSLFGKAENFLLETEQSGVLFSNVPIKVKKGSLLNEKESFSSVYGEERFKTPKSQPFGYKAQKRALQQQEKIFTKGKIQGGSTKEYFSQDFGRTTNKVVDIKTPRIKSDSGFLSQKELQKAAKMRFVQERELGKQLDLIGNIQTVRSKGLSNSGYGKNIRLTSESNAPSSPFKRPSKSTTPQTLVYKNENKLYASKPETIKTIKTPEGFSQGYSSYSYPTRNPNRVRVGNTDYIYGGLENVGVQDVNLGTRNVNRGGFRVGQREKLFSGLQDSRIDRSLLKVNERLLNVEKERLLNVAKARDAFNSRIGTSAYLYSDGALNAKSEGLTGVSVGSALSIGSGTIISNKQKSATESLIKTDSSYALKTDSLISTTPKPVGGGSSSSIGFTFTPPNGVIQERGGGNTPRVPRIPRAPETKTPKIPIIDYNYLPEKPKKKKKKKFSQTILGQEYVFTPSLIGQTYNVGRTSGSVFSGVGRRRRKS